MSICRCLQAPLVIIALAKDRRMYEKLGVPLRERSHMAPGVGDYAVSYTRILMLSSIVSFPVFV